MEEFGKGFALAAGVISAVLVLGAVGTVIRHLVASTQGPQPATVTVATNPSAVQTSNTTPTPTAQVG